MNSLCNCCKKCKVSGEEIYNELQNDDVEQQYFDNEAFHKINSNQKMSAEKNITKTKKGETYNWLQNNVSKGREKNMQLVKDDNRVALVKSSIFSNMLNFSSMLNVECFLFRLDSNSLQSLNYFNTATRELKELNEISCDKQELKYCLLLKETKISGLFGDTVYKYIFIPETVVADVCNKLSQGEEFNEKLFENICSLEFCGRKKMNNGDDIEVYYLDDIYKLEGNFFCLFFQHL